MAFEARHLDLQFDTPLANCDGLMLEQAESVNFVFASAAARHFVQRVLQPLPFAGDLFFARPKLRQSAGHVRHSMVVPGTFYKPCSTKCSGGQSVVPDSQIYLGSGDTDQPDPRRRSKAWTIACAQTHAAVADANAVLQDNGSGHHFIASFRGEQIELDLRSGRRSVLTCTLGVVPKNHAWRLVGGYTTRATQHAAKVEALRLPRRHRGIADVTVQRASA